MGNEIEKDGVDPNELEDIPDLPNIQEGEEDTTDWIAEAKKYQGIAKRYKTKLTKTKESQAPKADVPEIKNPAKEVEKTSFDYAERAYLKSSGVESEDFDFLFEVMKTTGKKDLDEVLGSKHIIAELNDRKEERASKNAIPSGSSRSGDSAKNTEVGFWLAKGELPPANMVELRRKVVNAKIAAEGSGSPFSDTPVV